MARLTHTPRTLCALSAAALCAASCSGWTVDEDGFTEQDRALMASMVLAGAPVDPLNELAGDERAAAFGQQLFFDQRLAGWKDTGHTACSDAGVSDGGACVMAPVRERLDVSCADCHDPEHWYSDARASNNVSQGAGVTDRNAPSLVNVGFYKWYGWDGRADLIWGQLVNAYEGGRSMAGNRALLLDELNARYAGRWQQVFGEALPQPPYSDAQLDHVYRKALKAIAAYLMRLVSADAPFDRYAKGERSALSHEQRRGLALFIGKAGCVECHRGPHFTDNTADRFHSVGIGQKGPNVRPLDLGRYEGLMKLADAGAGVTFRAGPPPPAPTEADVGQFRTKSLRQIAKTGPYFHAGQLATLKDVVWFYNQGGDHEGTGAQSPLVVPLGLTDSEQAELVAFLEALTGEPVPAALRCDDSVVTTPPRFRRCAP